MNLALTPSSLPFKGMFFGFGVILEQGKQREQGCRGGKAIVFVVYPSLAKPTVKNIHL
jgi:hypothetical protein